MTMNTAAPKARAILPLPAILKSTPALLLFFAIALMALWGLSFATFGVPGLYLPAVGAVPVVMILLLVITRG